MNKALLLSLIITCWQVTSCWAETITVTLPPDQYHRLTRYACEHPIWKFRAAPEACAQGDDAILRYMMQQILTTGSMGQIQGMQDLSMEVTITHDAP